jgi:hypothetical protein
VTAVGVDCQVILDGAGYFIEPVGYTVTRPRVRRADRTGVAADPSAPGAGAGERYIDRGPGKRVWSFTVLCFQAMKDYAGRSVSPSGQEFHDALQASYNKVNTVLAFTDPGGASWSVRFDDLVEELADVRAQTDGLQWYMRVTLVEA